MDDWERDFHKSVEVVSASRPCADAAQTGVYVICASLEGPSKIGITTDLPFRVGTLQVGNWHKLRPAYFAYFCNTSEGRQLSDMLLISKSGADVEAAVHAKLSDRRMSGEWFDVSAYEAASMIEATAKEIGRSRLTMRSVAAFTGMIESSHAFPERGAKAMVPSMAKNFKALKAGVSALKAKEAEKNVAQTPPDV